MGGDLNISKHRSHQDMNGRWINARGPSHFQASNIGFFGLNIVYTIFFRKITELDTHVESKCAMENSQIHLL